MPELPEVESIVRALRLALEGRRIVSIEVLEPSVASGSPAPLSELVGRRVERLGRRGKYLLAELSGGYGMAIHLRMTGWLGLRGRATRRDQTERHVRLILGLGADRLRRRARLVFRDPRKFGRVWCGRRGELFARRALAGLGPEPLEIGREEFIARLLPRGGRLKSVLLDQTFLAGLGNIYADEALHAARLHPLRAAHGLTRAAAARLHRAIRGVLRRALAAGGTSFRDYLRPNGAPGGFREKLKAYGRAGQPCARCGGRIRRIVVGQRGTWFCPRCQRQACQ